MDMQDVSQQNYSSRCLEALDVALNRTRMYASWRSLDPGESAPLDARYAALPALTKADLRAHFPYGLVPQGLDLDAALARHEVSFVNTSGTADEAVTNLWDQEWWNGSERASWSLNDHAARALTGSHREAILASALSVGPRSQGLPLPREGRTLGNYLFLNEFGSTAEWPEGHERRMRAELEEYVSVALEANPSLLARLARWALREGAALFQPRLITLTYEFPSALQLRVIRRVFSCPIASSYGSTEAGYVFMECEHGRLHQNDSYCRADIVPLEGIEDRSVGRILVTTFGNRWFPLLRFEVGDLARISPEPCPCGRTFGLTLSGIEGRLVSIFSAAEDRLVTHGQMDRALAAVEGVDEYRLDQESPARVRVRLVLEGSRPKPSAQRDAQAAMHGLLGDRLDLEAEVVDCLWPEVSGKFLLARRHFPLDTGESRTWRRGSDGR
jgi:phenylacetate-CoA ligase